MAFLGTLIQDSREQRKRIKAWKKHVKKTRKAVNAKLEVLSDMTQEKKTNLEAGGRESTTSLKKLLEEATGQQVELEYHHHKDPKREDGWYKIGTTKHRWQIAVRFVEIPRQGALNFYYTR